MYYCHFNIWLLFFSLSVMSNSLQSHRLQNARLFCPPLSPGVYSNLCPLSQWFYLTISSSATRSSFCLQSFPASGSFPMSWLIASGGQSIGFSASASVLPVNIQDWFPLGFTGLISLQSKGLSRAFSSTTILKHQFLVLSLLMVQLSHLYMSTRKTIALTIWTFVSHCKKLIMRYFTFFLCTKSLEFSVYFICNVHLNSDEPPFKCSVMRCCHRVLYWTA